MAKIDIDKVSKIVQSIRSGKNQPLWSTGRRGGRGPENTKVYSQAEIDEMNRVNQQAGDMAYDIDGMNNLSDGTFLDIFPRYQENFQFSGKRKGPYGEGEYPSNFRVKRDLDGYRSDAAMNYPDTGYDEFPSNVEGSVDVPRMNMYGNGDFMNTDGLISPNKINGGKPEYIMSNEFPNDDYIVDPMRKITRAIDEGELGASSNMDGQLSGDPEWFSNKPWNTNEIYIEGLDDWDKM